MQTILSRLERYRAPLLAAVLVAALVYFGNVLEHVYALRKWLFWHYLGCWVGAVAWLAACLIGGYALLGAIVRGALPKLEQLTLGLALGVGAFGLAVFFVGLVHGLNVVTFFLLPAAFAAVGWRYSGRELFRFARRTLRARLALPVWHLPVLVLAVLALGIVYFTILSPDVVSFDVRWYHMPIAQRYALSGAVTRFDEGFWPAAFPHLLSYIYAWAFLAPQTLLFDRIELCAHLEFVIFLATLAQIPVLVRKLVPGSRAGITWVTLLLFPGLYIYDLNLHAGADRTTGYFALPIALTFIRAWRRFDLKEVTLFSLMIGLATLTKYTALPIVLPPALALFVRGAYVLARRRTRKEALAFAGLLILPLVVTAPHWLKNIVYYGDPMYPMLHKYFPSHPWAPEAKARLQILEDTGRPGSFDADGLLAAAKTTLTFSFEPNNWEFLYGNWPVFGSLFTLTMPCLLFVRGAAKVAWLYALGLSAVFIWYLLTHYDRYLVAAVPLMAGATATTCVLIVRAGLWPRVALFCLVALQAIWAGDTPFIRTHNLLNESPIRHVAKFLASAFERQPNRLAVYEPLTTIGRSFPKDATVLAHDTIMILGIDRNWVTDLHQLEFNYARLASPAKINDKLRSLGVTDLVWPPWTLGRDAVGEDLAFYNYAYRATTDRRIVGGMWLAHVPSKRPRATGTEFRVAYFGCGSPYRTGWYDLAELARVPDGRRGPKPVEPLDKADVPLSRGDFVAIDTPCFQGLNPGPRFAYASARGQTQLYVRADPEPN
jgi:hypothetical protein